MDMPGGTARPPAAIERRLLELLRARIPNIAEAARGTGISRPQLSLYLSGKKPIRFTELVALCEHVGVPLADLLAQAESDAEPGTGGVS